MDDDIRDSGVRLERRYIYRPLQTEELSMAEGETLVVGPTIKMHIK